MTRTDWVNACARRLHKSGGLEWRAALREAAVLSDGQADRNGSSGIAWESPEDVADAEIADEWGAR